jgi:hypothetical protein
VARVARDRLALGEPLFVVQHAPERNPILLRSTVLGGHDVREGREHLELCGIHGLRLPGATAEQHQRRREYQQDVYGFTHVNILYTRIVWGIRVFGNSRMYGY